MRHVLAFSLLIAALALSVAAQPLVVANGERVSVGEASSVEVDLPNVAAQADGSYLVVWTEYEKVFARGFDADGRARGAARLMRAGNHTSDFGTIPSVAALSDGRFVVAWGASWSEIRPFRSFRRIMLQVVDAAATPLGPAMDVGPYVPWVGSSDTPHRRDDPPPAVVADDDGVVAVACTFGGRILMRRFDGSRPELPPIAWPGGLDTLDLGSALEARLAVVPGGWILARAFEGDRVSVVRLDNEGRPRGPEWSYTVPLPPGLQFKQLLNLRLTADASGRFLLVWHEEAFDGHLYPLVTMVDRVRAQRFSADGNAAGEAVDLLHADRFDHDRDLVYFTLGDVEARRDGLLLVTWSLGRSAYFCGGTASSDYPCWTYHRDGDVHAGVFTADGTLLAQTRVAVGAPVMRAAGAATAGDDWVIALRAGYEGPVDGATISFRACGDDAGSVCLANRFAARVEWTAGGAAAAGVPLSVSSDTGAFWFFSPSNVELVMKVLDGTGVNGKHWVFFASLTDVEFDLVVTDTVTGAVKRYHNPRGTMASHADTGAFDGGASFTAVAGAMSPALGVARERAAAAVVAADSAPACPAGALCLADGRFVVTAKWRLDNGEGAATPIGWTGETGTFWFFDRSNVELAVKVLDGHGVNGHFWVFYASLSDVDFDLEVLDTTTGQRRTYHNPKGTMASRADVEAF